MMSDNLPKEAKLWGDLYALLCCWDCVHHGLAAMPTEDQRVLDERAEEIIRSYYPPKAKMQPQ